VVKILHPMPEAQPDDLQTKPEDEENFCALKFAHVFEAAGKTGVDMVTFDAERRRGICLASSRVAAEAFEHELHHVALAVVRRRGVGENKQLHLVAPKNLGESARRRKNFRADWEHSTFNIEQPTSNHLACCRSLDVRC